MFDALVAGHLRRRGLRAFATVLAVALGVTVFLAMRLADARAVAAFDAQTGVFGDEADFSVVPLAGGTLDAGLLGPIRGLAGVASAMPALEGDALVSGEVVHVSGRDLLAPLPESEEFRTVLPGPFAPEGSGPDPAELLDRRGAFFSQAFVARHRIRIGDVARADVGAVRLDLRASAIVPRTALLDPGTAIVDIATAQALFGRAGRLDRIDVTARTGEREAARARVAAVVPRDATVVTAGERRASVRRMAAGFSFDFELLGALALLAAIVLASDAVGISVVQRRAEIGTLRVLGATRFEIARTFLIEGALFGTIGGLFGAVAGTALGDAGGSVATGTDALARDPAAPLVAVLAGALLGACGALPPAIGAASIPPDRALRARPRPPRDRALPVAAGTAAACGLTGAVFFAVAATQRTAATACGSIACVAFVAAAALALPWGVARVTRAVANRVPDAPPPVVLALANARAMPRRIALAAGALGAGVALATTVVVLSASLGVAIDAWATRSFPGDLIVTPREGARAAAPARFPPALVSRIARASGIAIVRSQRTIVVAYRGDALYVANDGPADGAAIDSTFAALSGLREGDRFALPTAGGTRDVRVTRIDDASEFGGAGRAALDPRTFARAYRDDTSDTIEIALRPHADAADTIRRVRAILAPRDVDACTSAELRRRLLERFAPIVGATIAIAALALAMGALGLSTTLVALVLERRDDIRLLRFAGLSRAGVRATIVCESASIGAFGGAAGVALGVVLAAVSVAVDRIAFGWSIALVVPSASIVATLLATIVLAAFAGAAPARLAARIDLGRAARTSAALVAAIALAASVPVSARAVPGGARAARPSDVWRVLGHLRARDGSRYDVAATFFRYALEAPDDTTAPVAAFDAAALSIVDDAARTTTTGVRADREGTGLAHAARDALDLRVADWTLHAVDRARVTRIALHVAENDVAFDGALVPLGGALAVDPAMRGRAAKHASSLASGFALPRLDARGSFRFGTRRVSARGTFWIDRETTKSRAARDAFAWRFVIALDDGRVVFLRSTRRRRDGASLRTTGLVRAGDGTVTYLYDRDVRLSNAVGTTWRNARDVAYPSLFEAIVPPLRLDFALVPVVQAQEIDGGGRGVPFYDGALDVERAHPGPRDTGAGYVELTGYAGAIRPSP